MKIRSMVSDWTPGAEVIGKLIEAGFNAHSSRVNITEGEVAQLKAIDSVEAVKEYRQRARLDGMDSKAVRAFSAVLAEKISAETLQKCELAGLDAYEAALLGRGLAVRGDQAAYLAAFYGDPANRALYPEFVRRQVIETPLRQIGYASVDDIITGREMVGAITQTPSISDTTGPAVNRVAPGANLPTIRMTLSSSQAFLYKVGGAFEIPDEVARRTPLGIAAIFFRRLGQQMDRDLVDLIVETMMAAPTDGGQTATANKLTPLDLLTCASRHEDSGYNPSIILATTTTYETLLDNSALQDPRAYDLVRSRRLAPVAGCEVKKTRTTTSFTARYLLCLDREVTCALLIEAGSELNESDRFIMNQVEAFTFSQVMTPAILLAGGARKLLLKS